MAKIKSFGLSVYVDGDAVGGLTEASVSGVDVNNIDLTAHDSAGGWKEFVSGLLDGGTLDLTGKFNIADAGQGNARASVGDAVTCYVIHSDNSGMAFSAIVGGFASSNPLDDAVEFTASLKVTGQVFTVYPTLTVTGTLTSDGVTAVSVPIAMPFSQVNNGGLEYSDGSSFIYAYAGGFYEFAPGTGGIWEGGAAAIVPQSLTFAPATIETGTPIITGS